MGGRGPGRGTPPLLLQCAAVLIYPLGGGGGLGLAEPGVLGSHTPPGDATWGLLLFLISVSKPHPISQSPAPSDPLTAHVAHTCVDSSVRLWLMQDLNCSMLLNPYFFCSSGFSHRRLISRPTSQVWKDSPVPAEAIQTSGMALRSL